MLNTHKRLLKSFLNLNHINHHIKVLFNFSSSSSSFSSSIDLKKLERNKVADYFKEIEVNYTESLPQINSTHPFIIRLDGHHFKQFTQHFIKPYDVRIHNAMVLTSYELCSTFNASAVYTQSDEITLFFSSIEPTITKKGESHIAPPIFSGKIPKLLSMTASYCSARFNYHLSQQEGVKDKEQILNKLGTGYFDSRVTPLPDDQHCFYNMLWRLNDCLRNSKTLTGRYFFPSKHLLNKKANSIIREVKEKHKVDWHQFPEFYRYGTLIKKVKIKKNCFNPRENTHVEIFRSQYVNSTHLIIDPKHPPSDLEKKSTYLMTKEPEEIDIKFTDCHNSLSDHSILLNPSKYKTPFIIDENYSLPLDLHIKYLYPHLK